MLFLCSCPEAGGDVLELAVVVLAVEALVGGRLLQGPEMADEGADLYIVEIVFGDKGRDDGLATIPRHLELRMLLETQ